MKEPKCERHWVEMTALGLPYVLSRGPTVQQLAEDLLDAWRDLAEQRALIEELETKCEELREASDASDERADEAEAERERAERKLDDARRELTKLRAQQGKQ